MGSQKPGSLLLWLNGDVGTHWGNIRGIWVILGLYGDNGKIKWKLLFRV